MKHWGFFSYSGLFSALAEWLMLCYGCLPSTQEHPFRFEPISSHSPWRAPLQHIHTTAVLRVPCQQINGDSFRYPEFRKLLAPSSHELTLGSICQQRKEIHAWGHAASYCPHRRALLASVVSGSNMSHHLPCGGFAAEQHRHVPGFHTLSKGGNQQMQRKLNGQMNVKIIGATISDLMNMLLKLQLCLENKTKQKAQWM